MRKRSPIFKAQIQRDFECHELVQQHWFSWGSSWGSTRGGVLWCNLSPMYGDAGVGHEQGPPATKLSKCKLETHKLWHHGVEMFIGELDPAAAAANLHLCKVRQMSQKKVQWCENRK